MNHNYFISLDDDYDVVISGSNDSSDSSDNTDNTDSDSNSENDSENDSDSASTSSYDSYGSIDSFEFDNIYLLESEFADSDKYTGQYIIGISCGPFNPLFTELFTAGVSSRTFFRFPFAAIVHYLYCSSVVYLHSTTIDIIQIYVDHQDRYIAIKKTFWLRLVQRRWKKIYRERCDILARRTHFTALRYREIYGKYPAGLRVLPTIYGMMCCCYSTSDFQGKS